MFKPVDIEKFETFIGQVETNGVSSADVISFESLIGSNFITKDIKPNRFSSNRSSINANAVINRAREAISSINTEATKYTVLDVCNMAKKVTSKLENFMVTLTNLAMSLHAEANVEVLERMFNEKYTLWYRDDTLTNAADDENILEAFRWNRNYLQALVSEKWNMDRILDTCEKAYSKTSFLDYSPLLNIIAGKGFDYLYSGYVQDTSFTFKLTIRNLIMFLANYESKHKEDMECTLRRVKEIKTSYDKKLRLFNIYDYRDITTTYNNLQILDDLLHDELGNDVIDILGYILRK